jgi:hypothetical protein
MDNILPKIFLVFLLVATVLSFYLFIEVLVLKKRENVRIFDTWQFPMLFALTLDVVASL